MAQGKIKQIFEQGVEGNTYKKPEQLWVGPNKKYLGTAQIKKDCSDKQSLKSENMLYSEIIEEINGLKLELPGYEDVSHEKERDESDEELLEEIKDLEAELPGYEDVSHEKERDESDEELLEEIKNLGAELPGYEDISYEKEGDESDEELLEEIKGLGAELPGYEDISYRKEGKERGKKLYEALNSKNERDSRHGNTEDKKMPYEYALRILSKHDIQYIDYPKVSRLHRFNGRIWEPLSAPEDIELLVYEEMTAEDRMAQGNIENFCRRVAQFIKLECMEKYKSGEERFTDDDFKMVENRIVFKNCVYDVWTGEILPHNKDLPYSFGIDADYIEEDIDTPIYEKLKKDATKNDGDSMEMFDMMLGYLMIPNRSGKCFFVLADARDSGKSVFGHFIESMYMGERVKTIDLEHLSGRFALSNADSVVLLSGLEISTDKLDASVVEQIKKITGEKKIRMESKYKNEQTIAIRFKLLLATNGGLRLPSHMTDKAFYRRTIVVPFIKSMPLESHMADMPEMLQGEKSAILSKAARQIGEIINEEGGILFPESELSKTMKAAWMGSLNFGDIFIKKKLIFTGKPEDAIPKDDIYMQYSIFFEEVIEGKGVAAYAVMCNKDELMKRITEKYPGAVAKRLRRASMESADITPRPCMTCLSWK